MSVSSPGFRQNVDQSSAPYEADHDRPKMADMGAVTNQGQENGGCKVGKNTEKKNEGLCLIGFMSCKARSSLMVLL